MRQRSSFFLFWLGCALLGISGVLFYQQVVPKNVVYGKEVLFAPKESTTELIPQILIIPDIQVSVPIVVTEGNSKSRWQTTGKGVSYIHASAIPGETGNSVFYGHNWPNLLGRLRNVTEGQQIEISFSDGSLRFFRVKQTKIVAAGDTGILLETEEPQLTIYTCIGFLDLQRFVVIAEPL